MDERSSSAGGVALAISNHVSRLYLDTFGKGPLRIETFINGDVVTTVLRDVYTRAEQSLLDAGQRESVLTTRMHWQSATDERFRAAVSAATGRSVIAAVSGFDPEHGFASEVFLLAPRE